jgi:uncharacterized repeat protein (TIGR03803 family)
MRLIAVLAMLVLGALRLTAQTTTSLLVLHTFSKPSGKPPANDDGAYPASGLILHGKTLFGTTSAGGAAGYGTVFQMDIDGSGFSTLYNFTNGTDGAAPEAPLLLAGGMLYGTASAGGASNDGTIFVLDPGTTNFSILYTFTNGVDGAGPAAGLVLSGSTLYGTTTGTTSGSSYGTLFMIDTNSSSFSVIHRFSTPVEYYETNSDGFLPSGPLVVSGGTLYGAAYDGGPHGTGTLFTNNGTNFGSIYPFAAGGFPIPNHGGANPLGGVVLSGATLYGAAYGGGSNGYGTVYKVGIDGSGFSTLYAFTAGEDYLNPQGPLLLTSNMLFGSTPDTIFGLTTNGTGFTNLFSFPFTALDASGDYTNSTGYQPNGGLVMAGQSFYGTTQSGGTNGYGTIFALNLFPGAIPLTIHQAADEVILTWTNSVFALQSSPMLAGPFTNVPSATSPYTNALTGAQSFFRLQAN